MKKLLTICLICFLAMPTKALHAVDAPPEFPGGEPAMLKFIAENIKLPTEFVSDQNRVVCQFVVEKDGSISEIQIMHSSGDDFIDQEVVRMITTMPKWKPGEQQGELVRTTFTLPIIIRPPL